MPFKYYVLFFLLVCLGLVSFAPYYLTYQNPPIKSDTVVLLVGPEGLSREEKVKQLISDGYSGYLLIPAFGEVLKASGNGRLSLIQKSDSVRNQFSFEAPLLINWRVYENTHVEILLAKSMMDDANFRSAIFVSAPYHMRRIELIAERVFDEKIYHLVFVPITHEDRNQIFWWLDNKKRRWIVSEYIKIFWLLVMPHENLD